MSSATLVFGLVLLACGVACGGAGGQGADRAARQRGQARLRLVSGSQLSVAPLFLAEAEGYFRDEGIELDHVELTAVRDGLPALVRGDVDVLTSSVSPSYLSAMARGARVRIVADRGQFRRGDCTYMAFLTRPETLRDDRLVRGPGSSAPWRFSVRRGTFYEMATERLLAEVGLGLDEIEMHYMSSQAELQSLIRGQLDVVVNSGLPMARIVAAGEAVIWRGLEELLPDAQFAVILFGPTLLDDDPDLGVRFLTAYLRGVRRYQLGKTSRNLETLAVATGLDRETLETACWIPFAEDGQINTESLLELQAWAVGKGVLEREAALEELWEPDLVEEAWQRLEASVGPAPTGGGS